jgi:hypothetical protein
MNDAIALSPATYDRFRRAASMVNQVGPGGTAELRNVDIPLRLLKVSSSTMGDYGYPATCYIYDESDGDYIVDPSYGDTVYVNDPSGLALKSGSYYAGMFAGFRGVSPPSAVFTVIPPNTAGEVYIVRIPDPATTDGEGLVEEVFIQDFTGLPVANEDGEEVLLYLVGGS